MGKRHNGEGTVYKRPDGSWAAQLSYLDPITGQRKLAQRWNPIRTGHRRAPDGQRSRSSGVKSWGEAFGGPGLEDASSNILAGTAYAH